MLTLFNSGTSDLGRVYPFLPVLLFSNIILAGQPIRLAIAALTAYAVGTHYLPDLREIVRRALAYLVVAIVIAILYTVGVLLAQSAFRNDPHFNPLIAGALIALVVSLFFAPLLNSISSALNAWMMSDQYA